jgi:hypothetical protein
VKGVGVNSPLVECLEAKKERRLPAPVSLSAVNEHVVCIRYSAFGVRACVLFGKSTIVQQCASMGGALVKA